MVTVRSPRIARPTTTRMTIAQRESLARVTESLAFLRKALRQPSELSTRLKGAKLSEKWEADYPYIGVRLKGVDLWDRDLNVMALRRLLPDHLAQTPIGELGPY